MNDEIGAILREVKTIALVGASARPDRPSHEVMGFLQYRGYRVIPVNPGLAGQKLRGEIVRASLEQIEISVDMVDVFRRAAAIPAVTDSVIAIRARVLWLQVGLICEEAAERARVAGLQVVMNHCPKIELLRRD